MNECKAFEDITREEITNASLSLLLSAIVSFVSYVVTALAVHVDGVALLDGACFDLHLRYRGGDFASVASLRVQYGGKGCG